MAFLQTDPAPLGELDLDRWAGWLKKRRLETPTVLVLESLKPLHVLIHQFLVFSSPIMGLVGVNAQSAVDLWEDPEKLEGLLGRLDP